MGVPEEIRRVERPKNTIVVDNGCNSALRYSVRERLSVKYVPGGNPQPKNGKVVGHIVDGAYVPLHQEIAESGPDMLSYGGAALVRSVTKDILTDLLEVYTPDVAYNIMAIATLKVIIPGIAANRMSTHYKRTFVSQYYPGAALSKNSVSKLYQKLGEDGAKRRAFYKKRMDAVVQEHHIAIDGTLKQDTSSVNDLSAFSRKARVKGCKDVSVLYAYDIELMEPVCAQVFPGNSIDASSYKSFVQTNSIKRGIIVSDKGFPVVMIKEELDNNPDLHFITPLKRNDVRIKNNKMLEYEGTLKGIEGHILYKKCKIKDKRFLYSFRDAKTAAAEDMAFLGKSEKKDNFSMEKYGSKKDSFGVIVFESDLDIDPSVIYKCYDDRWLLELVFRHYKNDVGLTTTNVQGDFSVIGSEFVNFISTVATCRIICEATSKGLLNDMSYGELMEDLNSAWRLVDAPEQPVANDQYWIHTLVGVMEELETLGLCTPLPKPEPKKRGRKKKQVDIEKPKRPRGRPRKNALPQDGL